jgi:nitroreductase
MNSKKNNSSKNFYDILTKRRSIRRFKQNPISEEILKKMVDTARFAPSAANLQPLEFIIVNNPKTCSKIFNTLSWAGYIKPAWKPSPDEKPTAYIIILVKNKENLWYQRDSSFAGSNIVHYAESNNIGSCILCKIDKKKIREILNIPEEVIIDSVIALGYKSEKSVTEELRDSIKYYRDEKQIMHVPKRKLEDILHINKFLKPKHKIRMNKTNNQSNNK